MASLQSTQQGNEGPEVLTTSSEPTNYILTENDYYEGDPRQVGGNI